MKCRFTRSKKDHKRSTWVTFPCGKCLPCRIRKRSAWALRLQLEARHSVSRSFWTLTLEDSALMAASEESRSATLRRFVDALQQSERRHGNPVPIRYFGCLEFGGRYARPHWHLMIFNLVHNYRSPPPYQKGLPRPAGFHSTLWPHGHIDNGEFNLATVHYVTGYLTDFAELKNPDLKPVLYRTTRPGIGSPGLRRVAFDHAQWQSTISERPAFLEIGGRTWPLDRWSREQFMKHFADAGGVYRPTGSPLTRYRIHVEDEHAILAATPRNLQMQEIRKEIQFYEQIYRKKAKTEAFELAVSERYERIAHAKEISTLLSESGKAENSGQSSHDGNSRLAA